MLHFQPPERTQRQTSEYTRLGLKRNSSLNSAPSSMASPCLRPCFPHRRPWCSPPESAPVPVFLSSADGSSRSLSSDSWVHRKRVRDQKAILGTIQWESRMLLLKPANGEECGKVFALCYSNIPLNHLFHNDMMNIINRALQIFPTWQLIWR